MVTQFDLCKSGCERGREHSCVNAFVCMRMCTCMWHCLCLCLHLCLCMWLFQSVSVPVCVCLSKSVYEYMCVCICVRVCVCAHAQPGVRVCAGACTTQTSHIHRFELYLLTAPR